MSVRRSPAYRAVADDLAARIARGEFPPGARLPSESEMTRSYGVSTITARGAVRQLGLLGLVETRQGSGTYVLDRRSLRVDAATQGAWAAAVRAAGATLSERLSCQIVPADRRNADLLAVAPDSPLLLRRTVRSIDDLPAVIESVYHPQWLVDTLPALALPHEPDEGMPALLASHGHPLSCTTDHLSARPPTSEESDLLHPPVGLPVLVQLRIARDRPDGPVLRVAETAYRGDLHELIYGYQPSRS